MDPFDVQFSDQEILHFAFVRGKDEKFRYDSYQNIKKIEENVNQQKVRQNAVVSSAHFDHKICVLCCASFTWRFRSTICRLCYHSVCKRCTYKETTCILCHNTNELDKLRKRWNYLFPYSQNSYIASKLTVPPSDNNFYFEFDIDDEVVRDESLFPWFTRNMVELKINELLDINIDESPVDKEPADTVLREMTVCLEAIINTFLSKCKFSDDEQVYYQLFKIVYEQQIADICYDMQITIQNIIQTGRNLVLNSKNINDRRNYGNLLATAVVNKLVLDSCAEMPEPSLNVAIQTDDERYFRHGNEFNRPTSTTVDSRFSQRLPLDYEIDSALGADDRSSVNSMQGWFYKETMRRSPLYSQPTTIRSVKHFFVSKPITEISFETENYLNEESALQSSSDQVVVLGSKTSFSIKPVDIRCESGQKATFHCRIGDVPQSDVYWYLNNKEVHDKGRFRLIEKSKDYYLEIYDTTPSDSGEVVCLIVNDTTVETECCLLKVEDYDVAGEDPYFEKVLENQVTPVGKKIIIEVKANGYPEPRVTFYHNRSVVHNDDRKIIENNFGCWSLEINNALPIDSGEYIAIAANRMGRASCKANLHVLHRNFDEDRFELKYGAQNFSTSEDDQIVVLDLAPRKKHSSTSC